LKIISSIIKIFIFNLITFTTIIIIIEIFFGNWFKNNFNLRLSSERNINRIYNFNFSNHKGYSHYIRDNNGFRVDQKEIDPEMINIVFAGGSTTNQKFLNYNETIVGILDNQIKEYKIVNSGVDGMSIKGHINSFKYWYNKIDNLKPSYYIFYIGVNDPYLFSSNQKKNIDNLTESSFEEKIREYLESNSFFYKQFRIIKSSLFLYFGFKKGANVVNKKTVVYSERSKNEFKSYEEFEGSLINQNYSNMYNTYLNELTNETIRSGSKIIYITQTSGYGMNEDLYLIAQSIIKHCKEFNLLCLNLAKELKLEYNDFYDHLHLNREGSKKVAEYLHENLLKLLTN
jgi:hypothetical protein